MTRHYPPEILKVKKARAFKIWSEEEEGAEPVLTTDIAAWLGVGREVVGKWKTEWKKEGL